MIMKNTLNAEYTLVRLTFVLVFVAFFHSTANAESISFDPADWRANPLDPKYSKYFHRVAHEMSWSNGQVIAVSESCPLGHTALTMKPLVYGMFYMTNYMSHVDTDPYFFGTYKYFDSWPTSTVVCSECLLGLSPNPLDSARWRCRTRLLSRFAAALPDHVMAFPFPSQDACTRPPLYGVSASGNGITYVNASFSLQAPPNTDYRDKVRTWATDHDISFQHRTNESTRNDTAFTTEHWETGWSTVAFFTKQAPKQSTFEMSVTLSCGNPNQERMMIRRQPWSMRNK